LSELNYVHAFREGNGRTNEAFIRELGREHGHQVEFAVITKPRMLEASIETTNDPSSRSMVHLIEDATDPGRREAIRSTFEDLRARGEDPMEHNIRTAAAGEHVTGAVLGTDDRTVSLVTDRGIIAADRADLPGELPNDDSDVSFTASGNYARPDRENVSQSVESPRQRDGANEHLGSGAASAGRQGANSPKMAQPAREDDYER
jgi:cell filamentation protein